MTSGSAVREWLSHRPPARSVLLGHPLVQVGKSTQDRGLGLYATQGVPAYTVLVSETSLILMSPFDDLPQLWEHFSALSSGQQERYLALSHTAFSDGDRQLAIRLCARQLCDNERSAWRMITVGKIMQANAFNVDVADGLGKRHRAVFPTVARINHSCAPNAHVNFQPPLGVVGGSMTVRALRDVEQGEEITIAYYSVLLSREERQQRAQKWGFQCACEVCVPTSAQDLRGEQMRGDVADWLSDDEDVLRTSHSAIEAVKHLIQLGESFIRDIMAHATFLRPTLPLIYDKLGMLEAKLLDKHPPQADLDNQRDSAVSWLEKAALAEADITGADSLATVQRLKRLGQVADATSIGRSRVPRVVRGADSKHSIRWE